MKFYLKIVFMACLVLTACTKSDSSSPAAEPAPQGKPTIRLSRTRIPASGWLKVYGTGFSPKQEVHSHLRRPDGTEYPEVMILTDAHGEFTHDIETLLFSVGTYKVWVVDVTSGLTSNEADFESTLDQGPSERPLP